MAMRSAIYARVTTQGMTPGEGRHSHYRTGAWPVEFIVTDEALQVADWRSLTSERAAVTEYRYVEDGDANVSGIFGMLFGYGTLYVQAAGTERNLKLTMALRQSLAR